MGNLAGFWAFATRLNAPKHWRTCAGSFCSYRSTVKKRSCAGIRKGADSHALRKCEMFSICTKGIADCLYLTPCDGSARFTSLVYVRLPPCIGSRITYLHNATPSLSASSKSPDGSFSPRVSSIHVLASFAAAGVYLDNRKLRMS